VQIALLTQRINHLTEHLQNNKKGSQFAPRTVDDGRPGRRLLEYLQNHDLNRYQAVTKKLKLRHEFFAEARFFLSEPPSAIGFEPASANGPIP